MVGGFLMINKKKILCGVDPFDQAGHRAGCDLFYSSLLILKMKRHRRSTTTTVVLVLGNTRYNNKVHVVLSIVPGNR
jgi:hypothetical protein